MQIPREILDEIALSEEEYLEIVRRLDREPNHVELGMFGALWSEHCGYKHSKLLLRNLPVESSRLMVNPGEENAGVVDIGDGLAIAMKIESHNHPSAVEPFQGAATGVGGIVRDIFAMGARPIALLNSLRFGPLEDVHNRHLFNGVVGGISWYGNCIGVPDVGGEVAFSDCYSGNPLVNAMCVGLLRSGDLVRARASGEGNILILVGSTTGRDGIHGASGLASRTFEEEREMRPTVQVGNAFMEKSLIEACLQIAAADLLVGMQDLGAAGMTSSVVEAAEKGGSGVVIDVSKVPTREQGMTPYEIMLSESQERMLLIVTPQNEKAVMNICTDWDLEAVVIGQVTDGDTITVMDGTNVEAYLPINILTDPPLYRTQSTIPDYMNTTRFLKESEVQLPTESPSSVLLKLLSSDNIASKEWIYRQYDHQVQTNTMQGPGGDAAVLRLKGTSKAIALATDTNGRYCYLDPLSGGAISVAEACRNLACVGAEPLAITDCLNFGNPERPDVYYQLESCVSGISDACKAFGIPVISGNVSLYNETRGTAIWPTPSIGALGLLEDAKLTTNTAFKDAGDIVILIGSNSLESGIESLSGSEYLEVIHNTIKGSPSIDLALETIVQDTCIKGIQAGIIKSAHDCSDGGLAVALAESCIAGNIGLVCDQGIKGRWDTALFGETQSRIVLSVSPDEIASFQELALSTGTPYVVLGIVGGERLIVNSLLNTNIAELSYVWQNAIAGHINS
ncbi:MAG: phosphoribosylformylglycinamidine synthase subunit PurL [SAR202 cluster bacterium]|nr:phosphoribosylformylglycinamidine synthase subunit PurL [SAR202 cluster bacterium]|tara:strand:- start:1147 stop:3357 length:2211 start_codon:yes stop_codon:yes gene_type:complete